MAACQANNFSVISKSDEGNRVRLDSLKLIDRNWQYRGEGNANIVLALQDDVRVIRLSKVKTGKLPCDDFNQYRRKIEREVMFANDVFGPLLGFEFVGTVHAVQISPEQIVELNNKLINVRPNYRQHKELRVPFGTSHCDFARIHAFPSNRVDYCVEIKPKQGWWPRNNILGKQSPPYCTYCLNQHLKMSRSKISSVTNYCPLDLFSGQPHRMIGAVISLIANPQNNLRIFRDGTLIYGESECGSLDQLLVEWIFGNDSQISKSQPFPLESNRKYPLWKISKALNNFICLLCLALIKPRSICDGGTARDNERYQELKIQFEDILKDPHQYRFQNPSYMNGNSQNNSVRNENSNDNCHLTIIQLIKVTGEFVAKSPCRDASYPLPESCILSRILEVQKLGQRGERSIYTIYQKICPVHSCRRKQVGKKRKNSDVAPDCPCRIKSSGNIPHYFNVDNIRGNCRVCYEEYESLSEEEFSHIKYNEPEMKKIHCPSVECLNTEKWIDEISKSPLTEAESNSLEHYLLAATAKDCSIMVTFSPNRGFSKNKKYFSNGSTKCSQESVGNLCSTTTSVRDCVKIKPKLTSNSNIYGDSDMIIQDMIGGFHRVRIGVADLDPKPLTSIVKHYIRDIEMVEAYETNTCSNIQRF